MSFDLNIDPANMGPTDFMNCDRVFEQPILIFPNAGTIEISIEPDTCYNLDLLKSIYNSYSKKLFWIYIIKNYICDSEQI